MNSTEKHQPMGKKALVALGSMDDKLAFLAQLEADSDASKNIQR